MIKRFDFDDILSPTGKMTTYLINGERSELLHYTDQLRKGAWRGRIIYYDKCNRGGVDIRIEHSRDPERPYVLFVSSATSWGSPKLMTGAAVAEEVRMAFNRCPLREREQPEDDESPRFAPAPSASPSPRPFPAKRGQPAQLALF